MYRYLTFSRNQSYSFILTRMNKSKEIKSGVSPYDIFIIALTLLSIFNLFLYYVLSSINVLYVVGIIDGLLSIVFLIDFVRRFIAAENKTQYFFRGYGWADLMASIPLPQFKLLRIFRLIKAYGLIKKAGLRKIIQELKDNRASGALYLIFFMIVLLLEFGSIAVIAAERSDPASNIKTASDAIWWVYVTITTVGYGDRYPVTNGGRIVGMLVMLVGVGLFGVITGFLANKFLPNTDKKQPDVIAPVTLDEIRDELQEIKNLLHTK
jgi:hypothetical protein